MPTPEKPTLLIYINNHFDPTWRRCWDRRFTFKGDTFISYADIESYYLLDNLELARKYPEYKFEAEFSLVVQKFLERHPDRLGELQRLAGERRFSITGGGQVIVDTNLILGESIVRNYLIGFLYAEDQLGQAPHLAVRNDGFGNSAQLPQILRGVGIDWATGMSYSPAGGIYWRGLDGSVIVHAHLPSAGDGGGATKYAPCPACRGTGKDGMGEPCPACHGRGIDAALKVRVPQVIRPEAFSILGPATEGAGEGVAEIRMNPEELLPNPDLLPWARSLSAQYDVRFALEEEARSYLQPWFDQIEHPLEDAVHQGVELNPNNTGVYVTRIRTKQNVRRQEYAMAASEALAVMAALKGRPYPHAALDALWKKLLFTMFHDSVTATHVDPAYEEIQDMVREIDAGLDAVRAEVLPVILEPAPATLSVFNPTGFNTTQPVRFSLPAEMKNICLTDETGQPVASTQSSLPAGGGSEIVFVASGVPAYSSRLYRLNGSIAGEVAAAYQPLAGSSIENSRFLVEADEHGLVAIVDKALNRTLVKSGEYRPGELILEHDEGSPWATLNPDQSRTPLADTTRLLSVEKSPISQQMTFEIGAPFRAGYVAGGVAGTLKVTLWNGIDRIDFDLKVHWNTFNHRLRVAFPAAGAGKGMYGIPYGTLSREPYPPEFHWYAANGDWPAVNWAGVEAPGFSVALLNKGLPSYRIEPDQHGDAVILLSVLRSPVIPTYLHEPDYYTMTEWDGMRDAGEHEFEFALTAYSEAFSESGVVPDAESYNAGLVPLAGRLHPVALPVLSSDCCRLAALKWAEKGQALVLRLVEYRGQGGEASLTLPDGFHQVEQTDLLERQGQLLVVDRGKVTLTLRPWEITTLRLAW